MKKSHLILLGFIFLLNSIGCSDDPEPTPSTDTDAGDANQTTGGETNATGSPPTDANGTADQAWFGPPLDSELILTLRQGEMETRDPSCLAYIDLFIRGTDLRFPERQPNQRFGLGGKFRQRHPIHPRIHRCHHRWSSCCRTGRITGIGRQCPTYPCGPSHFRNSPKTTLFLGRLFIGGTVPLQVWPRC